LLLQHCIFTLYFYTMFLCRGKARDARRVINLSSPEMCTVTPRKRLPGSAQAAAIDQTGHIARGDWPE